MRPRFGLVAVLAAAAAISLPGPATATPTEGQTTLDQTIAGGARDGGAFTTLRPAPGEARRVREDGVGSARDGRAGRRRSLLYFAQLSDFQLADEESPARVESSDPLGGLFVAAWRPQEAIAPWIVDAAIRQVNAHAQASPVRQGDGRRARMALALATGDNVDNGQRNEVEWVKGLLDGDRVDPNSGVAPVGCPPGTPGADEAAGYTGVQDSDDLAASGRFYDPDRLAPTPAGPPTRGCSTARSGRSRPPGSTSPRTWSSATTTRSSRATRPPRPSSTRSPRAA